MNSSSTGGASVGAGAGDAAGGGAFFSDRMRAFCSSLNTAFVLSVASRSGAVFLPSATSFVHSGRFLAKASAA